MGELIAELKEKIIETLDLIDVVPADIAEDDPLMGGKLGLDSIDILELAMMVDKEYGIKIDSKELGREVFSTLRTLADYIAKHRQE